MITMDQASTIVAGISCLVAAVAFATRCAVLSPNRATWPDAPQFIRGILWMLMFVLIWRGASIVAGPNDPVNYVGPKGALAGVLLAAYSVSMAINVLRQNYPVRVWRSVKKIQSMANCGGGSRVPQVVESGILDALEADGVEVLGSWAPNGVRKPWIK